MTFNFWTGVAYAWGSTAALRVLFLVLCRIGTRRERAESGYAVGGLRTTIDISWCGNFKSQWYKRKGLPSKLAWRLRHAADNLDGGKSYRIVGLVPGLTTQDELQDAIRFGASSICRYLDDIDAEKRVMSHDDAT